MVRFFGTMDFFIYTPSACTREKMALLSLRSILLTNMPLSLLTNAFISKLELEFRDYAICVATPSSINLINKICCFIYLLCSYITQEDV